jgi:hypothetical protein
VALNRLPRIAREHYRLADEKREIILVACTKCDWRAAFSRDDLIASDGADYAMPNLLGHLAASSCSRLGSNWDRHGVDYVEPIEGARWLFCMARRRTLNSVLRSCFARHGLRAFERPLAIRQHRCNDAPVRRRGMSHIMSEG